MSSPLVPSQGEQMPLVSPTTPPLPTLGFLSLPALLSPPLCLFCLFSSNSFSACGSVHLRVSLIFPLAHLSQVPSPELIGERIPYLLPPSSGLVGHWEKRLK